MKSNEVTIKETKGIKMTYNTDTRFLIIGSGGDFIIVERKDIFPLIRGLISLTQRFYRKEIRK